MALIFEWDRTKADTNVNRHGVSFDEAVTVFADPLARIVEDPRHSIEEVRLSLIGVATSGRHLTILFTERGEDRIRIISARRSTRRERRN
jgi:uncharacterized protein